jgi:uncharacterized protein (DUF488 family)
MPRLTEGGSVTIYTLGHSNVETGKIVELLRSYDVEAVLDVRSSPYSRHAPQFNREDFAEELALAGIDYIYGGNHLGGKPKDPSCYDQNDEDRVLYEEVEKKDWYQRGIEGLLQLATEKLTAVMCAEEDPSHCHRHLLIAQTLLDRDVDVQHIRHKGGESWEEPARRTLERDAEQLRFGDEWT